MPPMKKSTFSRYAGCARFRGQMNSLLIGLLLVSWTAVAHAGGQTTISNYAAAQRAFFWTHLYPDGGRELYCNVRFVAGQRLTVEHVYAADWIATHHGCKNRRSC